MPFLKLYGMSSCDLWGQFTYCTNVHMIRPLMSYFLTTSQRSWDVVIRLTFSQQLATNYIQKVWHCMLDNYSKLFPSSKQPADSVTFL
jgi:hypothetical protein